LAHAFCPAFFAREAVSFDETTCGLRFQISFLRSASDARSIANIILRSEVASNSCSIWFSCGLHKSMDVLTASIAGGAEQFDLQAMVAFAIVRAEETGGRCG
jgi:hypothetical protein